MLDKKIQAAYNIKYPISRFPNVMGKRLKNIKEVTK